MINNPFIYKRPLYPDKDELVMIERRVLLERTLAGLELGHWFSLYGGKKTGKTSFLLRLIDACRQRHPDYHWVSLDLEELPKFSQAKLNKLIFQKANAVVSAEAEPLQGVEELKKLLLRLSEKLPEKSRIIFVLDGFETAPKVFMQETLQSLVHVYQSSAACKPLAKFQFIVAGTLTLNDLLFRKNRAFSEYAMKVFLDDFALDDIEEMLNRVCAQLHLPCQTGFARLLHEATGGMGYLVQKICYRILETALVRNEKAAFTVKNADEAIFSIIGEGETNVEMIIRQIEKDNNLVESLVRTLRAGAVKSDKFDHHLKCLVSLGALTERNGAYRVRNLIYKSILQDYFTTERLADIYLSQKKYYRAKELFKEALTKQSDAQNALEKLLLKSKNLATTMAAKGAAKSVLQIFMKTVDGAQNCSLMMFEADHRTLKIVEAIGLPPEDMASFVLKNGAGVAGWVAQLGRTRVVRDVTDEIECPEFVDRALAVKLNVGAMISLPLQVADQVIGVINLCLSKPHEFTSSEVKMLEILAAQASIVLQNIPLYHSVERHQNYLEVLQDISQELVNYSDAEIIFTKILAAVPKITGSDKAYLVFKIAANDSWQFKFAGALPQNGRTRLPNLLNHEGIAGYVLATGEPYFAADAPHDLHYFQIWDDVRSELAVPLLIDHEVNGCLVNAGKAPNAFSEVQQKSITMLAALAGLAIKNRRLYSIAEKNTQQAITSKGIGEAISDEKGLQDILNLVARECLNVVGYPNKVSLILLRDQERRELMIAAMHGETPEQNFIGKPLPEKSLAASVLKNGKAELIANLSREPKYNGLYQGMRSEIAVPLIFREEVIGVIDVQSAMPDDFDRLDQEALLAVAHNAAIAIANARLREDLKKTQIDLARALETAAIEETVAGFTHDIKNISSMISGEAQWLNKLAAENKLDSGEVKKSLGEIDNYVKKIEDYTGFLKQRAYRRAPQSSWFTLKVVIDEGVRLIAAKAARHAVKIKHEDAAFDVQLRGDSGFLVRAFFNIMTNAIDAMPEGGVLGISAQRDHEQIQIEFSDTGSGISEENLGRVSKPLYTTKEKGYGLGLAITRRIIETDHHGKLVFRSETGKGTVVEVRLPLHPETSPDETRPRAEKILVVNDNRDMLEKITQVLRHAGHDVVGSELGKTAVELCQTRSFAVIIIDYHLNKDCSATQTAADFLPELKRCAPTTPIILTSASLDQPYAPETEYDFFLEINHAFWSKITGLIGKLLQEKSELQTEQIF